jgi:hypothetical protein
MCVGIFIRSKLQLRISQHTNLDGIVLRHIYYQSELVISKCTIIWLNKSRVFAYCSRRDIYFADGTNLPR